MDKSKTIYGNLRWICQAEGKEKRNYEENNISIYLYCSA